MTFRQLLFRNLAFYWRTNLAVMAGVMAATAVIAGALVVGDSVRDSLTRMSLDRLGRIDHVVNGPRFFREDIATEMQEGNSAAKIVAPVVILQGAVQVEAAPDRAARAGQINVYGVDQRMWGLVDHAQLAPPQAGQAVLNRRLADHLGLRTGEPFTLVVEIPPTIPRDTLLGDRNETVAALPLTVAGIAEDAAGLARLGLNPTQQLPLNVFVNLAELQSPIGLSAVGASRKNPFPKPARVNGLFLSVGEAINQNDPRLSRETAAELTQALGKRLALGDLALRIVTDKQRDYLSLESEQMYLEPALGAAAIAAAKDLLAPVSPVLVSLVNEIRKQPPTPEYSMYSVVAGFDPQASAPFGPLEFVGNHEPLTPGALYLNDWLAEDLHAAVGEQARIKYHVIGDRGELPEDERQFRIAGIVKLAGPAADPGFTPAVPGVTDAKSYDDWRQPFPLKKDKITKRDDTYWDKYKTTPKLFVSLKQAQELWSSRYGNLTSVRFAAPAGQALEDVRPAFEAAFLKQLDPPSLGLAVQPVKRIGLDAAQGTTDFAGLFIGFSFFLILSAALLTGLLFQLGIERRLSEIGLLTAVGLAPRQIRRLLLLEGGLLVGAGGILGLVLAVAYAAVMIHGLKTWWYGAIGTKFLFLSVHVESLLMGLLIAVCVALGAVWRGLRRTKRQSPRSLLQGELDDSSQSRPARIARGLAWLALPGSLALMLLTLLGVIPDSEAFGGFSWRIVMFFLVGMGLLTGSLAALAAGLGSHQTVPIRGHGMSAQARLGLRNAARNRSRSVLTASLIASATFVIVAVAAGQINPIGQAPRIPSGNGGFTLVAECNVPILYDLNTPEGRAKLGFDVFHAEQQKLLDQVRVFPFRMQPGENASCLNLYQTQLPAVLGIPDDVLQDFIDKDRFQFADTRSPHPWELLQEELPDGRIPVLGDMNTLMYSLHKGIGAVLGVPGDADARHTLEIRGMFANSVFQGVLVMSEANFHKLFPRQAGFRYFLIEANPKIAREAAQLLETSLKDDGFDVEPVAERLANFLSVQNTYLSTFQTLGGLGLLLGTLGLATVMLRNVLERAGEFALLRAVGFRSSQIGQLVAWENACLLLWGLLSGALSALLAMAPHLSSSAADVPWSSLLGLLGGVFLTGMLAAVLAVRAAVATPILSTLRGE